MLLTSWVESMRVAFEKSRKATLNPRRRLQLRSVPSSARQRIQRRVAVEQLEDRTLLTSLIVNQLTAGLGLTIDNSTLDPDADGLSNFDSIIFEDLTIDATSGAGVSIDLDSLAFSDPFQILFDNVSISSSSGVGVDIELSNLLVDTIAVDSSTISGSVGNAFNLNLTNVNSLNEFNIIDSTLSGQAGAGVTVALNASTIEETSVRRSNIDGVSFDVTNGSVLRHTTVADNSISGTSGSDGVSLNLNDSIAEEFRLTNNNAIQGVSIEVDDTVDGDAALLTELFIHSNNITGNTEGAGISLDLNNVDQFVSITDNSITSNSSHGVVFDQTDGDLSGDISGNFISNNVGHGIFFTPSTTNPTPTGDGAPGVPAYAGVPGPTDKIDFAAPRNEVQLITFDGVPSGGFYTITYTRGDGVQETTTTNPTDALDAFSTAAQVKAAMVDAFSDIGVDDILVNGNFQDGYEIEFVNAVGGLNVNPLSINTSTLTGVSPSVAIVANTAGNQSESQRLELTGTPTFGSFSLTLTLPDPSDPNLPFNSLTTAFSYDVLELSTVPEQTDHALELQNALNLMAFNMGYTDDPIEVTADANGFTINFLDTASLRDTDVPQIVVDDTNLRLLINVTQGSTPANPNKPANQTITFISVDEFGTPTIVTNPTVGSEFQLTFQGETTGVIQVGATELDTAANIDAALDALASATTKNAIDGDFVVTGTYATGFEVAFNVIQHLELDSTFLPHLGTFTLTFLGRQSDPLNFSSANPRIVASAAEIELELNRLAALEGYTDDPVSVVATPTPSPTATSTGFDIIFLNDRSLSTSVDPVAVYTDLDEIRVNDEDLKFDIIVTDIVQGSVSGEERQLLRFVKSASDFSFPFNLNGANITDPPIGGSFRLRFEGNTTGAITIATTPAATITNINNALEALPNTPTADDFVVTGNFTSGFTIRFTGDYSNINVGRLEPIVFPIDLTPSTLLGNFDISSVAPITGSFLLAPTDSQLNGSTLVPGVGINETQTITFPDNPKAGTFTLSYNGEVTAPLDFDATAAEVQAALQGLSTISVFNTNAIDDVIVTGSIDTGGFVVEFVDDLRAFSPAVNPADHDAGIEIVIDFSSLVYVLPTVTTIAEGTTNNEVQEIILNGTPTGGHFHLSFDDTTETVEIAYNASANDIYLALVGLDTINDGELMVRGDAMTGFEIEFIGRLAATNVPQVVVNDSDLIDSTMTVKTTSVGGYLRGIRGNTITGNSGAGVEIDLEMYTSFYGDLTGNTISSNQTAGVNLVAADETILHSIDFSLSLDGNTVNDNRGAGIAVSLEDTATGDISITNNTITGSSDDGNALTPYAGDAIYVDLFGTDVHFEAFSQLRDLTIDGNYIGTNADNAGGLGNFGSGVAIHIEESTIIDRTQISNNVISNNIGDGVNFHREDDARVGRAIVDPIVGEERAVLIHNNTITGNSDGIDILTQNGSLTTTDFEIKDNILSANNRDGLSLHAEADSLIFADIINNEITLNSINGIESTTRTSNYNGTDRRDVAGTWIQNTISNNSHHGIEISGRIGNHNLLFIGLEGVDPVTGIDRGNMIEANGRDGIQIAAFRDRVDGNVKIANNQIVSNQTGGLEMLGRGLVSSVDNNLIAFNNGKGVDINSNGQVVFLRGNTITENTADGLEILSANSIGHSEDGATFVTGYTPVHTSVTAIGNFIDNNGGRGVDLQTENQANSDFIFGDGTETGANRIVSNALEGFYVVTTASAGQDQDANSTATLDANGSTTTSSADMVLQVDTNYIQDNGVNSSFSANGLILRIGTMAANFGSGAYYSHDPGSRSGLGDESGGLSSGGSNGRSNVSVTGNSFEGNFGEDVYIESFTSTVDPNTTGDNWDVAANPSFRVLSSYQRDPLAKLNLVFEENTGNGLDVVNFGAYYDNAEPIFKSRTANGAPAPNPDGNFNSPTRRRNAQRVASRAGWAPSGAPNDAPAIGAVFGASIDPISGRILIQSDDVSLLSNGSTVQISPFSDGEAGELPEINPAYGIFFITDIDYGANTFTLESTEGADLTGLPTFGAWTSSEVTQSFLFDGTGVSTFRVAQGAGNNSFQSGDHFYTDSIILGNLTGERLFSWDTWVPNDDSFLTPTVSTFLTADISVADPDPASGAIDPLIISFTEDVLFDPTDIGIGVSISDFVLLRDNVPVTLDASMLTQLTSRTFELDLSSVTGVDGEYVLRLLADGTISDAKYIDPISPLVGDIPLNYLTFGDVERFTVDTADPEVDIVDVTPAIRSGAVGEVVVNFTEEVNGVDLGDFTLTFDGGAPVNLATTPATLTQVTGSQFVLDLSKLTNLSGVYDLTLDVGNSSITDLAGNGLAAGAGASISWENDTLAPLGSFDPVIVTGSTTQPITFKFVDPIVGGSLVIEDFTLIDGNGNATPLTPSGSATPTLSTADDKNFIIDLDGLADANGQYTLVFNAAASNVVDDAGNQAVTSVSVSWENGTDFTAPTAGIQNIDSPRATGEIVEDVFINFSEPVNGVDINSFALFRDTGNGLGPVLIDITSITPISPASPTPPSSYILDLDILTGSPLVGITEPDGEYTFILLSDGITDEAGNEYLGAGTVFEDGASNTYNVGAMVTWRTGMIGPTASFDPLPAVLHTDAGVVNVAFSEAVTGVDIDDFQLTLNGQIVPIGHLSVDDVFGAGPLGSEYSIDLSTVTTVDGDYKLTLVAANSDIRDTTVDTSPLFTDASVLWTKSSAINLNISAPVLDDIADSNVGDGVIGDGTAGTRSLRAAIQEANALAGSNTIELAAGLYQLSIGGIDEDLAATGDLDIQDNLTIRGQGVAEYDQDGNLVAGTVIDGGALDRIFQVFAGITLNLENLTITNGALTGSADGAGIRNSGTTTLTNVEVTGNSAQDSAGGLNNTGLMILVDSTVSFNTAGGSGGGIRNTGTLEVTRSTIHGNSTSRDGGAIFNAGAGNATLSNSTFSGNTSTRSGGAIRNTATVTATNNTFTLNDAGTNGGAISSTGTVTLQNNLIFLNTATTNAELQGDFNSLGGNLTGQIGTATGLGSLDIVDVVDTTPVIDITLADNGGPTLTHALLMDSIAIDAGVDFGVDEVEQRGSTRIIGSSVDIGAVEYGTFFVNSFLDTVDAAPGDGVAQDANGNVTLRAAIMEANALAGDTVIVLGAGMYDLTILNEIDSDLQDGSTGDLDITDITGSLTITGAGSGQTIINASALDDRVFDVLVGTNLILDGVTVTGGHAIDDVDVADDGDGGGIRNLGTLTLINTDIDGNTADLDGGGIFNGEVGDQGVLILTNSTVSNNSAVNGAGVYNNVLSTATLVDSEVSGNIASGDGGGFFNAFQGTIDLTRSSVSGNTAILDGGGIYNNDLSEVTINDSKVNNNTADQGAGIFNEADATLTVNRTTVSGNNALLHGGGIYNDEGVVVLDDVTILTNHSANDGGGIYNASAGEMTIINGFFDENSANRDGGAIANFGVSLSISDTTIRDSEALRNGGGLFNDQEEGAVILDSTSLINNEAVAGAGIYNQDLGTINVNRSTVSANIASTSGGGIYNLDDATMSLFQSTVDGNIAANHGAGIYNESNAQLNVVSSTISNNSAAQSGGGIYNNSIALSVVQNATISGNTATDGGGIYNDEEGSIEVTNATIFNNTASNGGGVVNAVDGFVSVANSIIAGNHGSSINIDVQGDFVSLGTNLIGVGLGSTGFTDGVNGDLVGTLVSPINPGLGALQDNGGGTYTHELVSGSLARDAGNNFYAPTDDQRGFARLFDGDGNGSLIVDIGAFESGYIVTSFTDSVDAAPGDGVSVDANGQSTLRAAVIEANARAGADTILLGSGTYTLSLFGELENGAMQGDLDITDDLTIIGAGSAKTFIDADFLDRIFHIFTDVNVSLRGVTLLNGSVTRVEDGGAILNFGNLTLEDVTIENSLANRGGALFNSGYVTMTGSSFHSNTAIADGGAIFNNDSGTIIIDLSTITGNDAESGGGIFNSTGGTLSVNDTTIDGNTATVAGGGVFVSSEAAVGNGEGGSGVNIPAASSDGGAYIYDESAYEEHWSPRFDNDESETVLQSEAPPFPISDTFNLSSLPGASHTIYLDFNGHTTTGTQWNASFGTVVTPAYDTDGDVGTFSLDEHEVMQRTWLRVAEDFAAFNVNVTTVEPPTSDLINSGSGDTRWGIRVVVGENTWYPNLAGGVAYLTSFNSSVDTPTFVFNTGLIGVAEAASHEVGHTLGLSHDGTSTQEYYPGHGGGVTGWAPIMGVGYSQNLVQWSSGEYTDADNTEDDLSIITTQNGFGYRADDHGGTTASASTIIGGTASGIIERSVDVDFFQFTTTGGDVTIDPFFESPNLDILAVLYDSDGTQIQTSNPIGALNASFTGLAAGTYYVSIDGTGEGNVLGTGYSDYSSLGQYTITVGGQPPPVVVSGSVSISNSTISNNFAGTRGGGLLSEDPMTLSNVTFSGNEAGKEGGAIHNTGALTIDNTTIYDNFTEGTGGGIYSVSPFASVNVKNTIIAGNTAWLGGTDVTGTFSSEGHNLIGTSDSATGFVVGFNDDIVGSNAQRIDPMLSPLQDNGGPTFTHALLVGSRAIDAGDNTDGVVVDQRGALRPTDTTSDIGAYEVVTPTISISDINQLETNSGTTVFEILVSLSNANVDEVSVEYKTSNGTAIAGDDYEFTTGIVTFSPGETTQTIEVTVNGDDDVEDYETFFVNLYNAVGATVADSQSLGTIQNDDAEIQINNVEVDEGPVGITADLEFTVSLTYPVEGVVTVDYVTADRAPAVGNAEAGSDYVGQLIPQTLTFNPGEASSQTVTVVVNGDSSIEPDEVFDVELSNATNTVGAANILTPIGVGTIKNDDLALLSVSDVSLTEDYDMGATTTFNFTVSLSQTTTDVVTFYISTVDGSAVAGPSSPDDYLGFSNVMYSIAAGDLSVNVPVTVYTDSIPAENNEAFTLEITSTGTNAPVNAGIADGVGVGTIIENGIVVDDDDLDPTYPSLREAIDIANQNSDVTNIILLEGDYFTDDVGKNEDLNETGDFDIMYDVNIFGQGSNITVIDAQSTPTIPPDPTPENDLDRIFHTHNGARLNLSNVELRNGNASDGGAILAQGPTTLNQVIFRDNKADFWGGAIVSLDTLDISDAQFLNNHAGFQGGALYQYAETATITRATFDGNTSDGRAGAVYVASPATFDVTESSFNNSVAGSRGGAIYSEGVTTSTDNTFSENHAGSRGGAIYSGGTLTVTDNTFNMNSADQSGGGIYHEGGLLGLTGSTFTANTAGVHGGAIYNDGALDMNMENNVLSQNTAGQSGGGIYNAGTIESTGTTFSGNSAGVHGGAIFNEGTLDIEYTTLSENTADHSGGGVYNDGVANFTNTTFSANHANVRGGAIYNDGTLELLFNTLTLNTADQWGGGISNSVTNTVTMNNTIVAGNIAVIGNDDLDGDYSPIIGPPIVASQYNLIGNIGMATGLSNGVEFNIVGTSASPIDAMLDVLAYNGPTPMPTFFTLTHNLLPGSPAIDTGNLLLTHPVADQRGQARPVNGSGLVDALADIGAVEFLPPAPPPLYGTKGDVALAVENTSIQLSVVTDQTAVANDGHTAALPADAQWIHEWDSFWVEVWVNTASGMGISDVLTEIAYNSDYFTATSVEYGSIFGTNTTAIIDDAAGVIRNMSGSTEQADVGGTGHALFARIKFESLAGDQVDVDPTDLTVGPLDLGLEVRETKIEISDVGEVVANVGELPQTDLYPVIYDVNDDDAINFRDLMFFASVYSQDVYSSSSDFVTAMDYDKSGRVDFRDLTLLAANYGKRKDGNTQVNFPANFGQKWIGTSLEVASGDDSISQVIEAAVDTWETALDLEEPLEVQVIVRDFGTAQLGSGQTTEYSVDGIPVAGRVVIDDDANGLGWHVDVADLPAGTGYDLYTVLLHEIGHVLGFTRYYSGFGNMIETAGNGDLTFVGSDFTVALDAAGYHVEDPAYADDLMAATLDPGVRKTLSDLDVKMLLEAYENAGPASGPGSSAPVFGTNIELTQEAKPELVQSFEAAKVFVEQSTVDVVAPAAIKKTEEDSSLVTIRQSATFDAIQPSLVEQGTPFEPLDVDESLFEDLYSSEFENSLIESDSDDRQLVFAHSDDELVDDFSDDLESMDDAFSNWEGPLL